MQVNRVNSQPNFKSKQILIVKPHAIREHKVPEILDFVLTNTKGLKVTNAKYAQMTRPQAESHYAEHKGKSHFEPIVKAMTEGPVLILEISGRKAVEKTQAIKKAVRAKFGDPNNQVYNALHMSDSKKAVKRETALHLPKQPSKIQVFFNKLNPFNK